MTRRPAHTRSPSPPAHAPTLPPSGALIPRPSPSTGATVRRRVSVIGRLDAPDLLSRVLGVLLRRRCTVVHVDFAAADRHRPGRLLIAYDAPAAHADRTLDWLRALVDVLAVEPV